MNPLVRTAKAGMIGRQLTTRSALRSLIGAMALLLAPATAQACAVCMGGAEEEVRKAFIVTTAFLSACPLLMIGGVVWWLRRTLKASSQDEAVQAPSPDGAPASGPPLPAAAPR